MRCGHCRVEILAPRCSNGSDHRVLRARFDSVRGVLAIDSTFRDSGAAMPHAAVFGGKP